MIALANPVGITQDLLFKLDIGDDLMRGGHSLEFLKNLIQSAGLT